MKRMDIGYVLLIFLTMSIVLPVLAAQEQTQTVAVSKTVLQSILEPAKLSTAQVSAYLPKLAGLLAILVVGSLVALGIAGLAGVVLKAVQLEKGAKQIKIPEILKKGGIGLSLSDLLTDIIFFLIIVVTLITALEFYGVNTGILIGQILAYLPQVIAAVFILVLGILVAILISGIITLVGGNIRIAQSTLLGNIAKCAIITASSLIALRELGAGIILTDKAKDIILGGLVLTLALGFGLGLKEKTEDFLNKAFKK